MIKELRATQEESKKEITANKKECKMVHKELTKRVRGGDAYDSDKGTGNENTSRNKEGDIRGGNTSCASGMNEGKRGGG